MKKLITFSALAILGMSAAYAAQFNVSPGGWYERNNKQIDVQVVNQQGISLASGIIRNNKQVLLRTPSSSGTAKNVIGVQVSYTSSNDLTAAAPRVYCYNTKFLQNNQGNSVVINDPNQQGVPDNFNPGPCFK